MSVTRNKLEALHRMTRAIGSTRHLETVLEVLTRELQGVLDVRAVSVKLLSADLRSLSYAVASGLPKALVEGAPIELERSALNRRVIEGREPFVSGEVSEGELFQFGEQLVAARFKSVLFVPLAVNGRVLGILGAYRHRRNRFGPAEVDFARLTADLVGIAIDSARAYEQLERSSEERARFLRRVAHNLRAPLSAIISMLEVVRGDGEGTLAPTQEEYLRRIERRTTTMLELINDLMALATSHELRREPRDEPVPPAFLATRLRQTFEGAAQERGVELVVTIPEGVRPLRGDPGTLEQTLENLLSNAIKYSFAGGRVELTVADEASNRSRITVSDQGIGIPESERIGLFAEFFRASNAKVHDEHGTGLGLAVVKEVVTALGGQIEVDSELDRGTTIVLHLPTWAGREEA